ncbi:hypothetical protein H1R20_g310, partial [Candolleomyces eurysporus]
MSTDGRGPSSGIENARQDAEPKPASSLANKSTSTWGERVKNTKLSGELPFLINTYHFSSIQTADDFLADAKLLSDVGEFHHYDSYSLTPTSADGAFQLSSPASLTLFVQTHSAMNSSSVQRPGITIRDVRYTTLLDHLYYSSYASVPEQPRIGGTLEESIKKRLLS